MFISDEASNNATIIYVALHGIVVNYIITSQNTVYMFIVCACGFR